MHGGFGGTPGTSHPHHCLLGFLGHLPARHVLHQQEATSCVALHLRPTALELTSLRPLLPCPAPPTPQADRLLGGRAGSFQSPTHTRACCGPLLTPSPISKTPGHTSTLCQQGPGCNLAVGRGWGVVSATSPSTPHQPQLLRPWRGPPAAEFLPQHNCPTSGGQEGGPPPPSDRTNPASTVGCHRASL